MNEQRVELFIKDRKFSFMIPFNDYVPFKKAEKKIIDLIENIEHTEEQLDDAIVYSALQLAIENEKLKIIEKATMYIPGSVKFLGFNYWGVAVR